MDSTQGISSKERDFLRESNAIEDIWDDESLLQAEQAWLYLRGKPRLSDAVIRKTHKILMAGHIAPLFPELEPKLADKKYLGHYRDVPVYIAGRQGLPYWIIKDQLQYWILLANKPMVWEQIKEHHVFYERIHPFIDGNGRTGRLFLNWQRVRSGHDVIVIPECTKYTDYYKWFK